MDRRPKVIFQLDTPFTTAIWPALSTTDHSILIDLVCEYLSPIGHYRSQIPASKGKRSKKRKRKVAKEESSTNLPAVPEVSSFVVVGLSSVMRSLEASAHVKQQKETANGFPGGKGLEPCAQTIVAHGDAAPAHLLVILVLRSAQSAVLYAHLPQLVVLASRARPDLPPTRLVQLPEDTHSRLSAALGLPRISCIGLLDGAPNSWVLMDFVLAKVAEVEIPWLKEAQSAKYLPLKVNAIETTAPLAKKKKNSSQNI